MGDVSVKLESIRESKREYELRATTWYLVAMMSANAAGVIAAVIVALVAGPWWALVPLGLLLVVSFSSMRQWNENASKASGRLDEEIALLRSDEPL